MSQEMNRRQFVSLTVAAVAATAVCGACCGLAEAAEGGGAGPTSGPSQALAKTPVDVGAKTDYASEGVYDKFNKSHRVLIIRHEGKIYAPTATCTHKNAVLRSKEGIIVCPSHGSRFSLQGTPIKGPAKASLYRYAISLDDKGHIIVDRAKQFAEKDWESEGASIPA